MSLAQGGAQTAERNRVPEVSNLGGSGGQCDPMDNGQGAHGVRAEGSSQDQSQNYVNRGTLPGQVPPPVLANMLRSAVGASRLVLNNPANSNFNVDPIVVDAICNQILFQAMWLEGQMSGTPTGLIPPSSYGFDPNAQHRQGPSQDVSQTEIYDRPTIPPNRTPKWANAVSPHEAVAHTGARDFIGEPEAEMSFAEKMQKKMALELQELAGPKSRHTISEVYSKLVLHIPEKSAKEKTAQASLPARVPNVEAKNLSLLSSLVSEELSQLNGDDRQYSSANPEMKGPNTHASGTDTDTQASSGSKRTYDSDNHEESKRRRT